MSSWFLLCSSSLGIWYHYRRDQLDMWLIPLKTNVFGKNSQSYARIRYRKPPSTTSFQDSIKHGDSCASSKIPIHAYSHLCFPLAVLSSQSNNYIPHSLPMCLPSASHNQPAFQLDLIFKHPVSLRRESWDHQSPCEYRLANIVPNLVADCQATLGWPGSLICAAHTALLDSLVRPRPKWSDGDPETSVFRPQDWSKSDLWRCPLELPKRTLWPWGNSRSSSHNSSHQSRLLFCS